MSISPLHPRSGLLDNTKRRVRKPLRRGWRALSFGLAVTALLPTARAATEYWDTGAGGTTIATQGSGTWNTTTTNWESTSPTKIIWTNGNVAAFSTAGATVSSSVNTNAGTTDAAVDSINVSLGQSGLSAAALFFNNTGFVITAATAQTLTVTGLNPSLTVANGKTASLGSNATINFASVASTNSSTVVFVGGSSGGTFNIETGGTLSYGNGTVNGTGAGQFSFRTATDATGESSIINVAGTLSFAATTPTSQISLGQTNGAVTMNVNNGGLITSASTGAANNLGSFLLSNNGAAAILNINTGGTVTLSGTASTAGLNVARVGAGTVNFNGGTLTTARVFKGVIGTPGASTGTFNFNGGTLTANVTNDTNFMTGLTRANVRDGGALINTNGFNVTIGQALVHSNVAGNNPNTGNPDQATDGGLTKSGAGTLTLTGANTYTGATALNVGTLALSGGSLAGTAVTTGTATTTGTLQINGAYTIGTSGSPSVTLTANNAALSLQDTTINTLTLNSATAGATALIINGGNTLSFDAGATTGDQISLGAGLLATASGTNTVNVNLLVRPSGTQQTLTLINAPGGFTGSSNFTLGTISGAATAANSFGLSLSLTSTPTQLQLVETATAAPATAYFTGSMGASWAANNGSIGNFSTDSAGTTGVTQLPGATTDVHLYATNANTANVASSTLDSVFSIKTLTVDGGTLGENGAVGIAPGTGGSLTITPTDPATGITVNSGAGAVAISAPVTLGAAQMWTNNSTSLLTVSGAVTIGANTLTLAGSGNTTVSGVIGAGAGGLVMNGTGTLTLSGGNSFTGGTTVNAGIVSIAADANLGTAASGVTLNGGTLTTTGGFTDTHAITVGAAGGTLNVNAGTMQLYLHTANTLLGSGPLMLTGAGTLAQATGNLRVDMTNSYSGTLTATGGGIFEYGVAGAVGTGASLAVGNQGEVALQGSPAVTLPNPITISGGTNSVLSFENGTGGIYSGAITLNATATVGLRDWYNYATVRSGTISGVVSGAGGLSVNSGTGTGGTLTLTGVDNFAGGITATGASNLTVSGTGQLGAGSYAGAIAMTGGTLTVSSTAGQTLSGVVSGTAALAKSGAATLTLSGANTYSGGTTISGGTVVMANASALGASTGLVNISGGATLDVATAGAGDTAYNLTEGSTTTGFTLASDVATPGTGVNHMLGNLQIGNGNTVNVVAGANVTGGTASISLGALTFTSGLGAGTTTFNPTSANLTLATAASTTAGAKTLALDGTSAGNQVTGAIADGAAGSVILVKSNTSTWTLAGANTYTGTTTVSGGTLLVNGSTAAGSAVTVGSTGTTPTTGTLGGTGTLSGAVTVNSGSTIQPGATAGTSVGTLTVGNATTSPTFTLGGNYVVNLTGAAPAAGTTYSQISTLGALTLNSTTSTLTLNAASNTGFAANQVFNIVLNDGTDTVTGTFNGLAEGATVMDNLGDTFTISYVANADGGTVGNDIALTYTGMTAVPEPTTVLGGLLLVGASGWTLRRRSRAVSAV